MFGQDGSYSHEAIVNRINADLANDLGNLAQRSLSMIAKNCDGKIPEPGAFTDADKAILAAADGIYAKAREAMDRQGIKHYLDAVWARGGGRQPLLRRRGAVGQAQDRPQAHGDDPLRDGGGGAAGGDPGAAGDAGGRGQAARRPGTGGGCAQLRGAGRGGAPEARHADPAADRRVSRATSSRRRQAEPRRSPRPEAKQKG